MGINNLCVACVKAGIEFQGNNDRSRNKPPRPDVQS